MKKVNVLGLVAVAGLMLAAQSASAIGISRHAGYYSGNGGEFTVYGMGVDSGYADVATYGNRTGFQTFCLEGNEYSTSNPDPDPVITFYAIEGGFGGADPVLGGDPISIGTAWLYRQFSDGVLDGYDYDASGNPSDRALSALALQEAFWWLEHELTDYSGAAEDFLNLALAEFSLTDVEDLRVNNEGHAQRVGGVAVVNFTLAGALRQSMLIRVPDGGMTLAMLGVGLLGCAAIRRRCRK